MPDDVTRGMRVVSRHVDGLRHVLLIVVPADEIHGAVEEQLREMGQRIRLPGFRPGKVPIAIVRERYGAAVTREVMEHAMQKASERAVSEQGLRPAQAPVVQLASSAETGDLEFRLTVETLPDIPPVDIAALRLEQLTATITARDVDTWLGRTASSPQGETGPGGLDGRRQAAREELDGEVMRLARATFKRHLFDQLAGSHDFALPQGLVERELDGICKAVEETQRSLSGERVAAGQSQTSLRTEYRAIAERRVRLGLLLAEIGRRHGVEPGDSLAILEDRVVDLIEERAQIVRRVVPFEDLLREAGE